MIDIDCRRFLTAALGMVTAPCAARAADAVAQGAGSPPNRRWIDLHHHFAPPAWIADVRGKPLLQPANTRWTAEQSIDDMDKGGVAAAVVSITNPGLWFGDHGGARRLRGPATSTARSWFRIIRRVSGCSRPCPCLTSMPH